MGDVVQGKKGQSALGSGHGGEGVRPLLPRLSQSCKDQLLVPCISGLVFYCTMKKKKRWKETVGGGVGKTR